MTEADRDKLKRPAASVRSGRSTVVIISSSQSYQMLPKAQMSQKPVANLKEIVAQRSGKVNQSGCVLIKS